MSFVITKNDLISDIQKNSPRAIELLTEYGLSCANCFLNSFDNIMDGAHMHGMTDEEIQTMVDEINAQLKKEE